MASRLDYSFCDVDTKSSKMFPKYFKGISLAKVMKVYVYPESSQNIPDLFFNNGKNRGFMFFKEINPGFSSKNGKSGSFQGIHPWPFQRI